MYSTIFCVYEKKQKMWLLLGSSYMCLVLRYKGWPTLFFLHAGQILDPQTSVISLHDVIENIGKMDRNAV